MAPSLADLAGRFAAGEADVVESALRTRDDFERIRVDLFAAFADWRRAWDPAHAAFALTVSLAAITHDWPNAWGFLTAARDIVVLRPDPPGANARADAFEQVFHRVAVAHLAALPMPGAAVDYLDSIADRVTTGTSGGAPLHDARLVFARALAEDARSVPAARPPDRQLRSWIVPARDRATRTRLRAVAALYERSAADPDIATEAAVRRALVEYRLEEADTALHLLDAVTPDDPVVAYWQALTRGRVLLALRRRDEAARSFEHAQRIAPEAQTPAIALAAIALEDGRRDEAAALAERARTVSAAGGDPWAHYWLGERRHLAAWTEQLRTWRP